MDRAGSKPYLDVSIGGEKRLNPLYAVVGPHPIRYHLLSSPRERDLQAHIDLWWVYLKQHPMLQAILLRVEGIEDWHADPNTANHVKALWCIKQELMEDGL